MTITIKFVGSLKHASGTPQLQVDRYEDEEGLPLRKLIDSINAKIPTIASSLLDGPFADAKPNALMLVNGREISVLKGLDTNVKDGDEIVFIPVVHGG